MSDQQPSSHNKGNITLTGNIKGDVVIGHGSNISIIKSVYENGKPSIDINALKESLLELHKSLESAPVSEDVIFDAQLAAKQARKEAGQDDVKTETLVGHIKEIGDTLQSAGDVVKQGTETAASVLKIAGIVAPLVTGGAKVIASWFGLPLR